MSNPDNGMGETMWGKCSKCGYEAVLKEFSTGPNGKPLCQKCFKLEFKEWQEQGKQSFNNVKDLV